MNSYIIWAPNPDLFTIGDLTVRWYGLLFALGFIISQQIMFYMYRSEGKPERDVESLTIYMVIATIIGARLGHVLFYEPHIYLKDPIKIIKIWEGGLASHGAAFGILFALYLYVNYYINIGYGKGKFRTEFRKQKREGQNYFWVVDRIVIVVALTGCLIRLGNFMNSEIIGVPSGSDYGVVFGWDLKSRLENYDAIEEVVFEKGEFKVDSLGEELVPVSMNLNFGRGNYEEKNVRAFLESEVYGMIADFKFANLHFKAGNTLNYKLNQQRGAYQAEILLAGIARHPAQLYESISSLLLFFLLFLFWKRKKENTPNGQIFGIFLIVLFGLRFIYEFLKENQVDFESELVLNMGQWLSIPLIIAGIIILAAVSKKKKIS